MANILINNSTNDNNNLALGKNGYMQVQLYTNAVASGLVASDSTGTPNIGIHANSEGGNIRFLSKDKQYHWEMDANNNTTFRLYFGRENSHPDGAYEDYQYFTFNGLDGYITAKGFYGDLLGNASSASILKPTDNLDTTSYRISNWTPAPVTSNNGIIVWRETFLSSLLSPDTGDIVLWLSGAQQLNMTIDGHFWQDHDALVLDTRNFTSYVTPASISALGARVEFGIWGMKDPGFGDNWIRTTSYGLLPYTHGGIGGSHSALGEAGWWFNNSWIETMHTNEIYFNAYTDDNAFIHTQIHDTMTYFDFCLCDDVNDRFRWVGGLHNSTTGNTDWYESMVLTLQGINNSLLRLNGVFSCNDAHVDNKLYVSSGGIYINGHHVIRHDGEGINFNLLSGNGHTNTWEMDSHDGNLRLYTWREGDGAYRGNVLHQTDGFWDNCYYATNADNLGGIGATSYFRGEGRFLGSCNNTTTSRSYWATVDATDKPTDWGGLIDFDTGSHHQIYLSHTGDNSSVGLWTRAYVNYVWQPWTEYLNTSNYANWAMPTAHWAWSGQEGQPTWVWGGNNYQEYRVWNPANFSVNYANSSGWANSCDSTNRMLSTGWGTTCMTYMQTDGSFYGNSGWTHYLMCNHGDGSSQYNFTIGLPFWGIPMYQRQMGSTSNISGWKSFITEENYTSYCMPSSSYISINNSDPNNYPVMTVSGRVDMGCLLLTNNYWTGYGTSDPWDAVTDVVGRVYFKII